MIDPRQDIDHILFTEEQICDIVKNLADRINHDYAPSANAIRPYKLIVVAVMKGSVFFYADLIKKLNEPVLRDTSLFRSFFRRWYSA